MVLQKEEKKSVFPLQIPCWCRTNLQLNNKRNKHDFMEQLYMCYIDFKIIKASQNFHVLQIY